MNIRSFVAFGLMVISSTAWAEAVNLDCKATDGDGDHIFEVQLDESTQKISQSEKSGSGKSFNADGVFSAGTISWKRVLQADRLSTSSLEFELDRVTLGIVVVYYVVPNVRGQAPRVLARKEGKCEKIQTPERQI